MGAAQQPPRTIDHKGIDRRGNSALAQALDTGTPVPVDAAQRDAEITPSGFIVPPNKYIRDVTQQQPATEQPGFTPGPWEAQNDGNYNLVVINNGQDVLADCGLYNTHIEKRTQREANARLIAAAPNLYAYAKAEELKWKWSACFFPSPEWDVCKQNFDACLRSMGWDETTVGCMTFLKDYRAAALAKAGGR
jgi:hypothetical protein